MKIELPKETWFDILAFVPRSRCHLIQIVPQIKDRKFASILQSFIHNYGYFTLGSISIFGPPIPQLVLPELPMPANIRDFPYIRLCYLDPYVHNFLHKFRQNALFENINLDFPQMENVSTQLLTTLGHVLPLIINNNNSSINSIQFWHIGRLENIYMGDCELAKEMLNMARILGTRLYYYRFEPDEIALFNRWLYTPRTDGRPRVLILPKKENAYRSPSNVLHFINDSIKAEFSTAKSPISFFIRLFVPENVKWHGDICMQNGETKEKLVIKNMDACATADVPSKSSEQKMVLISRYPLNAGKKWIVANEAEALNWNFNQQNRRIEFYNPVNAMDNGNDPQQKLLDLIKAASINRDEMTRERGIGGGGEDDAQIGGGQQ